MYARTSIFPPHKIQFVITVGWYANKDMHTFDSTTHVNLCRMCTHAGILGVCWPVKYVYQEDGGAFPCHRSPSSPNPDRALFAPQAQLLKRFEIACKRDEKSDRSVRTVRRGPSGRGVDGLWAVFAKVMLDSCA